MENNPPVGRLWRALDYAASMAILGAIALFSSPALLMRPLIQARMLTPGCVIFLGKKRTVRSISYGDGLIGADKSARVLKIEFEDDTTVGCHPQTFFKVTRATHRRWGRTRHQN